MVIAPITKMLRVVSNDVLTRRIGLTSAHAALQPIGIDLEIVQYPHEYSEKHYRDCPYSEKIGYVNVNHLRTLQRRLIGRHLRQSLSALLRVYRLLWLVYNHTNRRSLSASGSAVLICSSSV